MSGVKHHIGPDDLPLVVRVLDDAAKGAFTSLGQLERDRLHRIAVRLAQKIPASRESYEEDKEFSRLYKQHVRAGISIRKPRKA